MTHRVRIFLLCLLATLAGCAYWQTRQLDEQYGKPDPQLFDSQMAQVQNTDSAAAPPDASKWFAAQQVLETRCAVCHGCYDSPCQLNLTAWEGVARGGTKDRVYDGGRLLAARLTRLFEDAQSTAEWRKKGFYPVLNEREQSEEANLEGSLLVQMLKLKHGNPGPTGGLVSDKLSLGVDAVHQCPTLETFDSYARKMPEGGMPYGLPALTATEEQTLLDWVKAGAPFAPLPALKPALQAQVAQWEAFLNQESLKAQLSSRYMYEHLYLAHLYFPQAEDASGESRPTFFKLVRSASAPGQPLQRIATRRPFDDPGVPRVYYRLVRDTSAILAKTHMPYALDDTRLKRWKKAFHDAPYTVDHLPGYAPETASNPFVTFEALPQVARYRFMLEEAHYTISGFIKGPVCRGQIALNVINDYFWVAFVDPRFASLAEDAGFLARTRNHLSLPAEDESIAGLLSWRKYAKMEQAYLKEKVAALKKVAHNEPFSLGYLWNGDGKNQNASLTIFRHLDSATVVKGLVGDKPQTAWIVSYPLLERIHYLLVAGFDVYGNVGHQLSTRLYMDFLRMEGEFNFLALLPPDSRIAVRDAWYRDASDDVKAYLYGPHSQLDVNTSLTYTTDKPLDELYGMWKKYFAPLQPKGISLDGVADDERLVLNKLNGLVGGATTLFPETAVLSIVNKKGEPEGAEWFTLLRHRSYTNIAQIFREEKRHRPEEDRLMIVPGWIGAYPNVIFEVERQRLPEFVQNVRLMASEQDYGRLLDQFGVRRTAPAFWEVSDHLYQAYLQADPIQGGLLDYNRLENR